MKLTPSKLSIYISKEIFKMFFIIFFGLFILFFAIDFFEATKDLDKNIENALKISTQIVLFRTPNFLESILHLIILLASLFTFYKMSNNSEMIIIRASGKSIFQIIKFPVFLSFILGILVVGLYNPISSNLNAKSERLKNIYFKNEKSDLLELPNGIWFKQEDLNNNGSQIIIQASKVYKDLLIFNDVILIYIDKDGKFIKRINVSELILIDTGFWIAKNNYIFQEGKNKEFIDKITIPTQLTKKFIIKTIENNYDSIYNISIWKLRSSIKELKASGFESLKFEIRYYYLLTIPFLFAIMILISAYYGFVHARNNKKYLSIIKGIGVGFLIFISHNIITELTNSGRLTILDGSIFIVLLYFLISTYLLLKKDSLSNF